MTLVVILPCILLPAEWYCQQKNGREAYAEVHDKKRFYIVIDIISSDNSQIMLVCIYLNSTHSLVQLLNSEIKRRKRL